jgi:hypothetical protein
VNSRWPRLKEFMASPVCSRRILPLLLLLASLSSPAWAQEIQPLALWTFDETHPGQTHDAISGIDDPIGGYAKIVPGVVQSGLRMDGESAVIRRAAANAPKPSLGLTVEADIAVNAYPWNWVPIVDQSRNQEAGYFFGLDASGRLGLQISVGGKWQAVSSNDPIPLRRWVRVAGTYDPAQGLTLYLNGKVVGQVAVQGTPTFAPDQDLLIGRTRQALVPTHAIHPKYPVLYSFDGILNDLRIYGEPLSASEIENHFAATALPSANPLPPPVLPSGPPGNGSFGAFYTTLHYDELWDAARRIGPDSDVVVRFDQSPVRLVFWQGTSYGGDWVTENNKWYTDEFVESMSRVGGGDFEPMSDKQDRYSHVRILENDDARIVIHWRYAQCECEQYLGNYPDPLTGWTDWADEYFTIYPDGVAVRRDVSWSTDVHAWHEFQETIVINGAGTRPEDNINPVALTIANMNGETDTYDWSGHPPAGTSHLAHPNIQVVNLKSTWKPFQIVPAAHASIVPYTGEKTFAMFEWWNHWPVTQVASSGISALVPDRASHSSLSHLFWDPYAKTANSVTKIMLAGMTTKAAADLLPLAKSWLSAPAITIDGAGFSSQGYDQTERAFMLARATPPATAALQMHLQASPDSPLHNPAFIIRKWGDDPPSLTINGQPQTRGPAFRYGFIPHLEGDDLVIWLELSSAAPTQIGIADSQPR